MRRVRKLWALLNTRISQQIHEGSQRHDISQAINWTMTQKTWLIGCNRGLQYVTIHRNTPRSSILMGFSMKQAIHFGDLPFVKSPKYIGSYHHPTIEELYP